VVLTALSRRSQLGETRHHHHASEATAAGGGGGAGWWTTQGTMNASQLPLRPPPDALYSTSP